MFKNLYIIVGSFLMGYLLGGLEENKIKEKIDDILEKTKISASELKEIFVNIINNLEDNNNDEIKIKFNKLLKLIKDKFIELSNVEEKFLEENEK